MLSYENEADRTHHTRYYTPKVEIKDYNFIIDRRAFIDQPVNNNIRRYEII